METKTRKTFRKPAFTYDTEATYVLTTTLVKELKEVVRPVERMDWLNYNDVKHCRG